MVMTRTYTETMLPSERKRRELGDQDGGGGRKQATRGGGFQGVD